MTDLIERLRRPCSHNEGQRQRKEAAAEIERLRAEILRNIETEKKVRHGLIGQIQENERLRMALKIILENVTPAAKNGATGAISVEKIARRALNHATVSGAD